MAPYKVLVVDDSAFMRKLVSDMVAEDSRFAVVGTARNGREALELSARHRPDAITMDIEMPQMNGIEALILIMRDIPTPVIMLSSHTAEGAVETIRALEAGAVDFVQKPSGTISLDLRRIKEELLEKLYAAATSNKAASIRARKATSPSLPPEVDLQEWRIERAPKPQRALVAIGTSTGGPRALQFVLTGLPHDYPLPIVIVQHMPPGFTTSLAKRLDSLCTISVKEAEDGECLEGATAYIAPGGRHMRVYLEHDQLMIRLTDEPPCNNHRPSVDILFESISALRGIERTAVLMTGMGSDGACGMKLLRESGVKRTIAEDQSTCVVYGMPRAAVEMGCISSVVPLDDIPNQLMKAAIYCEEV